MNNEINLFSSIIAPKSSFINHTTQNRVINSITNLSCSDGSGIPPLL